MLRDGRFQECHQGGPVAKVPRVSAGKMMDFSAPLESVRLGGLGPDVKDELGRGHAFLWRHVNLRCQISGVAY